MKGKSLIFLIIVLASISGNAHAFGLLKYIWDGVSNQLGLDRGPIPKVISQPCPSKCDSYRSRLPKHVYRPSFHLQAEGY